MVQYYEQRTMIAAGGFDREGAMEVLDKGDAEPVAFGRHLSRIPISLNASDLGCRSTAMIGLPFIALVPKDTSITRPTPI